MTSSNELEIKPLAHAIDARVVVPGSKSYTNRALPMAALANGSSTITGALFSDDTKYMAAALRNLGIAVEEHESTNQFVVHGLGGRVGGTDATLFIGNSGTSARFLTPLVALGQGEFLLEGSTAMHKRPIGPLVAALNQLGGDVQSVAGTDCPPLRIRANGVRGGEIDLRGDLSSQYLSGLLISAPYFENGASINIVGDLVSKPYIAMTAQGMRDFGLDFSPEGYTHFRVQRGVYQATDYAVEPDASAASYFFAAAAITGGRVVVPGLGTRSLQGDLQFVRVLAQMGCAVRMTETETEVTGPKDGLRGVTVNMADISDTAQSLAAIAPYANAPTRITGIGFIRGKETDRVRAMTLELQRLGIDAQEEEDGVLIRPGQPQPALVQTYDDHRMAMAFAILGLRAEGVRIHDPACVSKTFPHFFEVLQSLY